MWAGGVCRPSHPGDVRRPVGGATNACHSRSPRARGMAGECAALAHDRIRVRVPLQAWRLDGSAIGGRAAYLVTAGPHPASGRSMGLLGKKFLLREQGILGITLIGAVETRTSRMTPASDVDRPFGNAANRM